ncbi:DUF3291 domain-containing protein [Nocardia sp. NPDC051030]|uniref:DUF3291 domain-containing protein n=1 Tax=Nocardia sp. NPDC051030 TaxID=3155162 RepID=UPI00341AD82D
MHLAQFNIGRLAAPQDDPRVVEFVAALDKINALADIAPGFIWRLVDGEANNATALHPYESDPDTIITMSVWESRDQLFDYVYRSGHMEYLRRRREWFVPLGEVAAVMWWVPIGHIPTVTEGVERLELLRANGPTPAAFTFRNAFEPQPVA